MKKEGYYSSGSFAAKAHVTKKTLRYYDEHDFLKPSYVNENGARFYTDQDFQKMQQIQMLKYLGFSLEDIREMTMKEAREESLVPTLVFQSELLEERIEQMKLVLESLQQTTRLLQQGESVDWGKLMETTNVSDLEQSMKQQYLNNSNIGARISLHAKYAVNPQGWFPWIYDQCGLPAKKGTGGGLKKGRAEAFRMLELGCGNGSFWLENWDRISKGMQVTLSDQSEGMLREAKKALPSSNFEFEVIDFHQIPKEDESYDLVLANHVLFYAQDLGKVLGEIRRVLKPGGRLVCSTYGSRHMKEISALVAGFDDRILLSAHSLYGVFGKENGGELLKHYFGQVEWREYEDHLLVTDAEDLIDYIISCHGNQNRYIVNDYKAFKQFVEGRIGKGFYVTKEAGVFLAQRKE